MKRLRCEHSVLLARAVVAAAVAAVAIAAVALPFASLEIKPLKEIKTKTVFIPIALSFLYIF